MRILAYEAGEGFGGAVTSLALLADQLRARGHELRIVVRELRQGVRDALGVGVRDLAVSRPSMNGMRWFATQLAAHAGLREECARFAPDVVLANNSPLANAAVAGLSVPTVQLVRGGLRGSRLEGILLDRVRGVLAVSEAVAASTPLAGRRVTVAPEGCAPRPASTRRGSLLMLSPLTPWKGHVLALRALAEAHRIDRSITLTLAGHAPSGAPGYPQELRTLARSLGIADRVRFLGFVEEIGELLTDARGLLLPSLAAEPFGRAFLEAASASVPSAVAPLGEPARLLADGRAGIVVPNFQPEDWGRALVRLWRGGPDVDDLADAAGRLARRFSLDGMTTPVEQALLRAVD